MIELIVAFLCGVLVTLLLGYVSIVTWFYSQPVVPRKPKGFGPYCRPQLPRVSCNW